jgi:hypothetical protein
MNTEEREYLVGNYMEYDKENDSKNQAFGETVVMHAENMNDAQLDNLYSAMILSPKTKFYQKKLELVEQNIENLWNGMVKKIKYSPKGISLVKFLEGVLPHHVMTEQTQRQYNQLSFTIKHLLRASYSPANNRFMPLTVFGVYHEDIGVQ